MTKGFTIGHVDYFPSSGKSEIPIQLTIEDVEEPAVTTYKLVQENIHLGFDEYDVRHETVEKTQGKVWGKPFTEYLRPWEFKMYLHRELNILMMGVRKDVVPDFLLRINGDEQGCKVRRVRVDTVTLQHRIPEVYGVWVGNVGMQNLHSVGLFGPHVNKSGEYQAAAATGKVSSLHFRYQWRGGEHYTQVTEDGGVTLFTGYEIADQLDLLRDIYENLLRPCLTVG